MKPPRRMSLRGLLIYMAAWAVSLTMVRLVGSPSLEDEALSVAIPMIFGLIGITIAFIAGVRRYVLGGLGIGCLLMLLVCIHVAITFYVNSD